jgi:hypothetical protein
MHLVGYLYGDYHDARSLEHKVHLRLSKVTDTILIKIVVSCISLSYSGPQLQAHTLLGVEIMT